MEKEKQVTRSETGRPVYQFPLTGMHPFHVLCGEIAPFPSHLAWRTGNDLCFKWQRRGNSG